MNIAIRTISPDEFAAWARAETRGFGAHPTDEYVEIARSFAEPDRTFAAFEGDEIVGTATTRTSAITVPGGAARLGFVDDVTVLPTHRRRGIMTRLMRAQLRQMWERGEPLGALTASESLIYERFGYGIATWASRWRIERAHSAMKLPPNGGGRLRFIDADDARREWHRLHERVRGDRVGMVHYDARYWRATLWDADAQRRGASAFFHVAYMRGARVAGLCAYRIDGASVLVVFLLGEDAEVEAELWRYCFGIDLRTEIRAFNQPIDDPLVWRLSDPRRLERSTIDHMWLRLVDVERALNERDFAGGGKISIRIVDDFCEWNDGVYRIESDGNGGECARTSGAADIDMTAAELASAYLGGASFATLARAGRLRERTRDALSTADRMFRTPRPPWSLEL